MTDLAERVTRLEQRMDDVEPLARGTGHEVAGWRAVLNGHTHVLNGMSDRLEQFRRKVDERFADVNKRFDKVDERFNKVDERFDKLEAKVDANFQTLKAGMDHITKLLTPKPSDES